MSVLGVLLSILPIDGALRSRGLTRHILHAALVRAALSVPLAVVGVRRFGLLGGIASWAVGELVAKAVLAWNYPRRWGHLSSLRAGATSCPGKRSVVPLQGSVVGAMAALLAGVALTSLLPDPLVTRILKVVHWSRAGWRSGRPTWARSRSPAWTR